MDWIFTRPDGRKSNGFFLPRSKASLFFYLTSLLFLAWNTTSHAQLAVWELSASAGNQASNSTTSTATGISAGNLSRGSGVNAAGASGSMSSNGWYSSSATTTLTNAIANNDYYEFTLVVQAGYVANVTSAQIALQASNTGPGSATLRSSRDSYAANLGATATVPTSSALRTFTFSLTNLTGTTTFRLYGYGSTAGGSTPGSAGTMRIGSFSGNDLIINGTATQSVVNPSVALSVSASSGAEATADVITVTATASAAVTGNQTVTLAVTGTGITTGDYNLSNTTITILNGATTGSVTFTIVDDPNIEGTETATLTISGPSAGITLGSPTSRTITITDNDMVTPTFNLNTTYCVGDLPETLPTTSSNSITGTWDPAAISTTGTGTTMYTFTPNAGQNANSTTLSVTINALPSFTATPSNGVCPETAPFVTLDVPAATGYKYDITTGSSYTGSMNAGSGGTAIGADPLQVFAFPAPPSIGGTQYTVRVIDIATGCYSDQTFTVSGIPVPCDCTTPAQVTFDQESQSTCGTTLVDINYNVTNGPASLTTTGAGILSTSALANGMGSFTYTPAIAEIGTTITITATIADPDESGPCTSSTDVISIQVNQPVSVEAGAAQEICNNQVVNLTTIGASISGGTSAGTWSSTGTGSFTGGTAFGSAIAYVPSAADKVAGKITLTLTSVDPAGACPEVMDTVVITVRSLNCVSFPWGK